MLCKFLCLRQFGGRPVCEFKAKAFRLSHPEHDDDGGIVHLATATHRPAPVQSVSAGMVVSQAPSVRGVLYILCVIY